MRDRRFPLQIWSSGPAKRNGVAILFSIRAQCKVLSTIAEIKGRLLAVRVQWGDMQLTIGSLYAPNERQEPFLRMALSDVLASPDTALLIGGDLNMVMDSDQDRSGQRTGQKGTLSQDFKQ